MSFSTFTHQPRTSNELIFIDVDPKPSVADVKEERPSSPDEKPAKSKGKVKERFQCSECSISMVSAERMMRHMRRHRGENPYQCTRCDYSTYNSTLFEEHVNIHKGVKPYQCRLCEYRSVSKKYIKKHESRHGRCECGFVARDVRLLRRHRRQAGCNLDQTAPATATATHTRKYACENCNIFYDIPESLKQHLRFHKICPECGEGFSHVVLQQHRVKVHGVDSDKCVTPKKCKFQCALCEWKSNWIQKILLHLIHHPNQEVDASIDVTPLVKAGILTRSMGYA